MSEITFHSVQVAIPVKNRRAIKALILKVFGKERYAVKSLLYIFCRDEYLLQLNIQHLEHDYYTDILTFLISDRAQPIEAEIYISVDRIKENAKLFKVSYQKEILRVMIHGALHLCDYNDDTENAKKKMRKQEDFYIQLYLASRET